VIRLRGKDGNPQAIGAMLTIEFDDGSRTGQEVMSANGYLSQSTGDLMFGLGPSRKIRQVTIRWPRGGISEQILPDEPKQIIIDEP
jgi:hypothetical protein